MEANDILTQAASVLGMTPGFGVGQALKASVNMPSNVDNEKQKNIDNALKEIKYLQDRGVIPSSQRYKDIQSNYQGMANEQMQTGNDIETVRNNGLKSLGLSGAMLAAPTALPTIIQAIDKSKWLTPEKPMFSEMALPIILNRLVGR
jgi:hypothetical protein